MKPSDEQYVLRKFVDALREVLGMRPLYDKAEDRRNEAARFLPDAAR